MKLTDQTQIKKWLDKQQITGEIFIRDNGLIDVKGDVFIHGEMETLPVNFGKVSGHFDIAHLNLKTLQGCPEVVNKNFNASYNKLSDLSGCPKIIHGEAQLSNNPLDTLNGAPEYVGFDLKITATKIKNFAGLENTSIMRDLFAEYNELDSLYPLPKVLQGFLRLMLLEPKFQELEYKQRVNYYYSKINSQEWQYYLLQQKLSNKMIQKSRKI